MPLRMSTDERNFEMDEETDYLLQPTDDSMRPLITRTRRMNNCSRFVKHFLCGYVSLSHLLFICIARSRPFMRLLVTKRACETVANLKEGKK